jgi:hypothetical protein
VFEGLIQRISAALLRTVDRTFSAGIRFISVLVGSGGSCERRNRRLFNRINTLRLFQWNTCRVPVEWGAHRIGRPTFFF